MKCLLIVVALVLIGGGAYYMTSQDATAPALDTVTETPTATSESMDDMEMMDQDGDDAEMAEGTQETMTDETLSDESTTADATGTTHTFDVTGVNFAFDVKEIRIKEGDTVTINFTAAEGFHDWVIDEFNAATEQVRPGTPTSVTFVADKAGTFEYYCSVGQHRANGMVGTLIVE